MPAPDPLRIIEAAYRWTPDEATWLREIADAAAPYAPDGGVVATTLRCAARDGVSVGPVAVGGAGTASAARAVKTFCRAVRADVAPRLFAPTEFAGNARFRLERVARASGHPPDSIANGAELPPMWAVLAGAPARRSFVLGFFAPPGAQVASDTPFPNADSRVLGLVGAHLGAALRLRALGETVADERADAILTPSGRVVHAAGATGARTRQSLAEAVVRSERARGRLRRVDATQATELWTALVQGQWSIVETSERDGKRYLVARRNELATGDPLALTPAENDVVWLAANGHSHKYMAYELGLSVATVTRRLRSAMRKLRVASRRDLLRKLGVRGS